MKYYGWVTAIMAAAVLASSGGTATAQEAHAHIGHVMTGWHDAPDGMGLLPVAQAEAAIAAQHANLAISKPSDIDSIRLHSGHVLHAIDPVEIEAGPGLGYGLERAAGGVRAHIGYAAGSADTPDNVKLHAEHVAVEGDRLLQVAGVQVP